MQFFQVNARLFTTQCATINAFFLATNSNFAISTIFIEPSINRKASVAVDVLGFNREVELFDIVGRSPGPCLVVVTLRG